MIARLVLFVKQVGKNRVLNQTIVGLMINAFRLRMSLNGQEISF